MTTKYQYTYVFISCLVRCHEVTMKASQTNYWPYWKKANNSFQHRTTKLRTKLECIKVQIIIIQWYSLPAPRKNLGTRVRAIASQNGHMVIIWVLGPLQKFKFEWCSHKNPNTVILVENVTRLVYCHNTV